MGHRQRALLVAGLSGGFLPSDVQGGVAWYDASDATTLYQDSALTTLALANADVVGGWKNKFADQYHVTQGTTANKATLRTAVQNGKPVVRFDGTDDFLSNVAFPDFGDVFTVFLVGTYAVSVDATQCFFDVTNGAFNTGFGLYFENTPAVRFFARDASAVRVVAGGDLRDGTTRLHRGVNSGSAISYHINTAAVAASAAYTAPNPNTLTTLTIGRLVGISSYTLSGDIAELLIYNTALSTPDITQIEAYLNSKWAVY